MKLVARIPVVALCSFILLCSENTLGLKTTRTLSIPSATKNNNQAKLPVSGVDGSSVKATNSCSLAPLRATLFLLVTGSSFVAFRPAPALIERLGTVTATKTLSAISATAALIEIAGSPIVGSLMDSIGRKPVLVCAAIPYFVSNLLVAALGPSVISLGLSKMAGMISVALIILASQTIMSDSRTGEQLSAAFGVNAFLTSFGFLCGALLTSLVTLPLQASYAISSTLIGGAIASACFMTETLRPENVRLHRQEEQSSILSRLMSATKILGRKNLRLYVVLLMISSLPQHMGDVFQIYSKSEWNMDAQSYASFISLFAIVGISGNVAGTLLVGRIGIPRLTAAACLSSIATPLGAALFEFRGAVAGAVLGFLSSAQSLGIGAALAAEGQRSNIPQGQLAGERSAVMALLKIAGPILYSALYVQGRDRFGISSLPFCFNIVLGSLGFVLSVLYLR